MRITEFKEGHCYTRPLWHELAILCRENTKELLPFDIKHSCDCSHINLNLDDINADDWFEVKL